MSTFHDVCQRVHPQMWRLPHLQLAVVSCNQAIQVHGPDFYNAVLPIRCYRAYRKQA